MIKNTSWLGFSNAFARLLKITLVLYAARILGPANYGQFIYAVGFVSLLFTFSDSGTSSLFIRTYQTHPEARDRTFNLYLTIRLILVGGAFGVGLMAIQWVDPVLRGVIAIVLVMTVIDNIKGFIYALFQANHRMERQAFAFLLETTATTVLGLIALRLTHSVLAFSTAYLMGSFLAIGLALMLAQRDWPTYRWVPARELIVGMVASWPFAVTSSVGVFTAMSDVLIIRWMTGSDVLVGYFGIAHKLVAAGVVVPITLSAVVYPFLSDPKTPIATVAAFTKRTIGSIELIAIPMMVGGVLLTHQMITLCFGAEYAPAVTGMRLMLLTLPTYLAVVFLNHVAMSAGRQVQSMCVTLVTTLVSIGMTVLLLPHFGISGVAISLVIANTFDVTITYAICRNAIGLPLFPFKTVRNAIVAASGMGGIIIATAPLPFVARIALGSLTYVALLLAIKEPTILRVREIIRGT